MSDLKPCPIGHDTVIYGPKSGRVQCITCGFEANIVAWNHTRAAPKVKPLGWEGLISDPYWIVINHNGIADLYRARSVDEDGEVGEYIKGGFLTLVSIDDLKAAAQADYERRILSALTPETQK